MFVVDDVTCVIGVADKLTIVVIFVIFVIFSPIKQRSPVKPVAHVQLYVSYEGSKQVPSLEQGLLLHGITTNSYTCYHYK